jgi:transketolase
MRSISSRGSGNSCDAKQIGVETLREAARVTGGRLVAVEDHWYEGGLGDAVLDAFAADHIAQAVRESL